MWPVLVLLEKTQNKVESSDVKDLSIRLLIHLEANVDTALELAITTYSWLL